MNIEKISTGCMNPAPYNPRKDLKPGDAEYEKLRRSMEEFGYVEPIVWNRSTGNIVSGHQRYKILCANGSSEIECVVVELDEQREKALNIAMNKVGGTWDDDKLASLITDLTASSFDISLTGFDAEEIDALFKDSQKDRIKEDEFDVEKALAEPVVSKLGDLWLLGRHRLVCGDSTKAETFAHLMDGKKANLCVTDPPYNCDISGGTGLKIMNDNMPKEKFYEFLVSSFRNIYENLEDGGAFYCFHSDAEKVNFYNAVVDAGFHYSTTCIWVKNSLVIGRMDYQMRHEPVIYGFKDTAKHKWYSDRKQTTVWEFDRPTKSKQHPTMKSIQLISYPILNSSMSNCIVLDPFGGSGSCVISCEQTDRICYTIEIDEKYSDVIVKRYIEQVGSDADVYVVRDGVKIPYSEVKPDE